MKNLFQESLYLQGARDLLLLLQKDYDMYLIPSVNLSCTATYQDDMKKAGIEVQPKCCFPLKSPQLRKMVGAALVDKLILDRKSLELFMQGNCNGFNVVATERDKKNKITKVKIELV